MDEFIKSLITQTPNIGVALVMLYWQKKTIDQLLANQTALIDRLLEAVDGDTRRAEAHVKAIERSEP